MRPRFASGSRAAGWSGCLVAALVAASSIAMTAAGCKGDGGSAVKVEPGAPAGDIVELAGTVTATRDGKARPLAMGEVVSGDDVVATGADGRVVIELRHNNVRWSLGPGRERKVADSGAWTAAKGATATAEVDERSGAAGRHAEREAADTVATTGGAAPAAAAPPPSPPAAAIAPSDQVAAAEPAAEESSRKGRGARSGGGAGAAGSEPADRAAAFDAEGAPSAKTAKIVGDGTDAEGQIAATAVKLAIDPHVDEIQACYRKSDMKKAARLELTLTIAEDGHVTEVAVGGAPVPKSLRECVRTALLPVNFPATGRVAQVRYPVDVKPAP